MSCFELAIPTVLLHEGVGCDEKDRGGITHYGISLRFLKTLGKLGQEGFLIGDRNQDGAIDRSDILQLQREEAIALYRRYWWEPYGYEAIEHQCVATKIFDLTVNMGSFASHRCAQRAVRAAGGGCLVEDGLLGKKSLTAINTLDAFPLLVAIRSEAASYYRLLHQPRYEKGWLNRAYA